MSPKRDGWHDATRSAPCPICDRFDWCSVRDDGGEVMCRRIPSNQERKLRDGSLAWFHQLNGQVGLLPDRPPRHKKPVPVDAVLDWDRLAARMYEHATAAELRRWAASELGVSVQSLELLGIGRGADRGGTYSSWPMRWPGRVVGIVRRYADG